MELENWRAHMQRCDITDAGNRVGCSRTVYNQSLKLDPSQWTAKMVAINHELKRIVTEREAAREEFIKESVKIK